MRSSSRFVSKLLAIGQALFLTLALPQAAHAQNGDYLGIMGPIGFLGEEWHLASASAQNEAYSRQAYLPQGDSFPLYKRMFVIETVKGGLTVEETLAFQVQTLEQRRETDPLVNMEVIENPATGEVLLDFVLSGQTDDGNLIVEWNAYRYAPHQFADGSTGVVLYAYSVRSYGDGEARTMLTGLRDERTKLVEALAVSDLPQPSN